MKTICVCYLCCNPPDDYELINIYQVVAVLFCWYLWISEYFLFKCQELLWQVKRVYCLWSNERMHRKISWCHLTAIRRVSQVEHEPFRRLPAVFSWVRVARSLVFYLVLEIVVCTFSFGHCVVCPSSIYWFWLPLWYLQTLLIRYVHHHLSLFWYFQM